MTVWVVVVAAGDGARFGGLKQFAEIGGRPLVDWSVESARSVADGVVLVVPADLAATASPESKYIELRFETYNTFNHTQFVPYSYQPNNGIGGVDADTADGPAFGQMTAAQGARAIQLAGKIYF